MSTALSRFIMILACSVSSGVVTPPVLLTQFPRLYRGASGPLKVSDPTDKPKVALTRETSKNYYLRDLIIKHNLKCDIVLLPVLQHTSKLEVEDNRLAFCKAVAAADVVVLTSPQAAMEFVKIWTHIESRHLKVASVGKKTASILSQRGIKTDFTPSAENALTLGRELPETLGAKILYPTSDIAQNTIPEELHKRGFTVHRINIYGTHDTCWSADMLDRAKEVDIVTLASPSAALAWVARAGNDYDAIVIGSTTLKTAHSLGFRSVTCASPDAGCLDGMVESIRQVLQCKEGRRVRRETKPLLLVS